MFLTTVFFLQRLVRLKLLLLSGLLLLGRHRLPSLLLHSRSILLHNLLILMLLRLRRGRLLVHLLLLLLLKLLLLKRLGSLGQNAAGGLSRWNWLNRDAGHGSDVHPRRWASHLLLLRSLRDDDVFFVRVMSSLAVRFWLLLPDRLDSDGLLRRGYNPVHRDAVAKDLVLVPKYVVMHVVLLVALRRKDEGLHEAPERFPVVGKLSGNLHDNAVAERGVRVDLADLGAAVTKV